MILKWFFLGAIAALLGSISDWIFYKDHPPRSKATILIPILLGPLSFIVVVRSVYYGIKYKLIERKRR